MPGSEEYSHGLKEEVLYSLTSKKDILDKLKNGSQLSLNH